jgi:DNA-directed RNA polymerase subunit RPC12/RpoP
MKVIETGSKWKTRVSCKACKALLEVEEDDLEYEVTEEKAAAQQYNEFIEGDYYVTCPECRTKVIIKAAIPQNVRDYVQSMY